MTRLKIHALSAILLLIAMAVHPQKGDRVEKKSIENRTGQTDLIPDTRSQAISAILFEIERARLTRIN